MISGRRRPTLSLHGPTSSCPAAKPSVVAVRVDGERSERGEGAQDEDVDESLPSGERVSRVQDDPERTGGGGRGHEQESFDGEGGEGGDRGIDRIDSAAEPSYGSRVVVRACGTVG
jgi:hypothetical protein